MSYQVGETIRLKAAIIDSDDEAANPATTKITINKPDGSVGQAAINMETSGTGAFYYDYLIPNNEGAYSWKVTAIGSSGRVTIVKDLFNVDRSI